MEKTDKGTIEYYCISCHSNISKQQGFRRYLSSWVCTECGQLQILKSVEGEFQYSQDLIHYLNSKMNKR